MSDEEEQFNPKAHKNLLQAISSLGKTQHIRKTTRNEPQRQQDEFQLAKQSNTSKKNTVGLRDIVNVLKTTKKHVDAGKQLKVVQSTKKVLHKPLEKPQADRIKRDLGYESAKKKLGRWDAVVARNRIAETQVFPLRAQESIYINTSRYQKASKKGANVNDAEAIKQEEALLKRKLTRDELIARRKELAYIKIRESQKSAKARMQNKIKSKKFHKLLKKQKLQEQIKQFEILQKTNPEAALEKLNELEKSRVLERASLRHKNTGSWAKNLQIRAKYDKDVRNDLSEQLQISRQLTQKKNDDDEESDDENAKKTRLQADAEVEANTADPFNPWTRSSVKATNSESDVDDKDENWRKYWMQRNENEKKLDEYKKQVIEVKDAISDEENEIKDISQAVTNKVPSGRTKSTKILKKEEVTINKGKVEKAKKIKSAKKKIEVKVEKSESKKSALKVDEQNIDAIFDQQEDQIKEKLSKKIKAIAKETKDLQTQANTKKSKKQKKKQKTRQQKDSLKNLKDLSFKKETNHPEIDEELNYENINDSNMPAESIEKLKAIGQSNPEALTTDKVHTSAVSATATIDPTKMADVKLKQRVSDLTGLYNTIAGDDDVDMDENDELEQKHLAHQMTISEAFEDDDIVADFTRDKAKDTELKNTEINLSMPGWGSWAGAGISAERQLANKNKRLVLNLAKEQKRRDDNQGDVYINEEVNKKLRSHLVSDLPFPFKSVADYEASIRAPIGRTFVPETAFRLLTRPEVITRKGQVIEPMDESELFLPEQKPRNVVEVRIKMANDEKAKVVAGKRMVAK